MGEKHDWSKSTEALNEGKTPEQIKREEEELDAIKKAVAPPTQEDIKKRKEDNEAIEGFHKEEEDIRKQLMEKVEKENQQRREEFKKKYGEYPPE